MSSDTSVYSSPPRKLMERSLRIDTSTDDFWMYEYKIRKCKAYETRLNLQKKKCDRRCVYAHPGEARRRNPRHFHYSSNWCADFRLHNYCPRGNNCKSSHGYYEYWFHPSRYHTRWCKYGINCRREVVCPFAHSTKQIRHVPQTKTSSSYEWRNLNEDCLVEIFQKVKVEELIYVIPFVCKSWYKASKNPDSWKFLDFKTFHRSPFDIPHIDQLIQGAVGRSCGTAVGVSLPSHCSFNTAVTYIADNCPALRFLFIPYTWDPKLQHYENEKSFHKQEQSLVQLICKWKHIETLSLGWIGHRFKDILAQIDLHCKKLCTLIVCRQFEYEHASAIVDILPKIKRQGIKRVEFDGGDSLKVILTGCKELEFLDISSSTYIFYKEEDKNTLKSLSRIKKVDKRDFQLLFNNC